MATYTWGTQPPITIDVTDNINRNSSTSEYYSGYITVTLGGCSGNSTFGYNIYASVGGTSSQLKADSPSQWSSGTYSTSFYVSGSTTGTTLYYTIRVGSTDAPRGYTDFSYSTWISAYTPPATEPASVPTLSASSAKLGTSVIIYTNRQNSSYTHKVTYSCGTVSGEIIQRNSSGRKVNITESVTWEIPKDTLIDYVTSSGTACTINCETFYGSTSKGVRSVTLTLYPPDDAIPTVDEGWFAVTRENTSAAQSITEWISGYSKAVVTFDESKIHPKYNSTISKLSVTYGEATVEAVGSTASTGVLASTSVVITATITDSRGISASENYEITLLDYKPPTITDVSIYRSDSWKDQTDDGHYICAKGKAGCTSLNGKNTVTLTGAYKQSGASEYGSEYPMQNETATLINRTEVSETVSYMVRLTATDRLGNSSYFEKVVPTKAITFHLKAGGKGAAFGGYASADNTLELADGWKLKIGGTTLTEAQLISLLNLL